jgi:hypothetical protein
MKGPRPVVSAPIDVAPSDPLLRGKRFIIALTTTPARLAKLNSTLLSLARQTLQPHKIYLFVPKFLKRLRLRYKLPPHFASDLV